MAQLPESLNMERRSLTFSKKHQLTISKNLAFLILFAFIVCIVVTALIAHYVTLQADETRCKLQLDQQGTHAPHDGITTPSTNDSTTIDHIDDTNTTHDVETTTADTSIDDNNVTGAKYLRLPRSVLPIDYDMRILTVMSNLTFYGSSVIFVNVTMATDNVTMHAEGLNITCEDVRVVEAVEGQTVQVVSCSTEKEQEFYVLHFDQPIEEGLYNITMNFGGKLRDDLSGYYASNYKNGNETRWIAATQFEPTEARRAFPCFDEPAMKATFRITIGRPNNLTSISNMPLMSSTISELQDYTWDEFQRSVPMSTYLVAYIVSDFKPRTIGNFSLYARDSAYSQTKTAADLGPKLLKHLEEFFDVPFPLPKMDLAAIPDFSAGAMENWGLITFRESNLLYEEGVSTKKNLQRIAIVIAHELGHQWFGNLVTPSWWTDLWLNEGFASYLEYTATDAIFPEWKMMDQFIVDDLQMVFNLDALKSSHPISIEVHNPNEISDIFDRISYAKGATIIRMMEDFLTTSSFRQGLTNYLNEKKYSNAEQNDLWLSLTTQAHKDNIFGPEITVKDVMDTWTLQMGFPVITVNRTDKQISLTQDKFELNRNNISTNYSWWVPLTYQTKSGLKGRSWLSKDSKTLTLEDINITPSEWFLVNLNQTGYYRVNYDDLGWSLLETQLKEDHTKLDPKNRAQIMNDVLSLSSAGYVDYSVALNISTYLQSEEEYIPWTATLTKMNFLFEMFQRSGHFDKFKVYFTNLIQPLYKKLGFVDVKSDPILKTYLREVILKKACQLGLSECIEWAHTEFRNWMLSPNPDNLNSISPNLKSIVYCTALETGGEQMWNFAWQRFINANVGTERELLMQALGCTKEMWLLNKYMTMAITPDSEIKKQDAILVFRAIGSRIVGQTAGMRFVISKWSEINTYMGKSVLAMNSILSSVTSNLNTEKELEEVQMFSKRYENDVTFSQRNAKQVIEQTQANIDWMNKYFHTIVEWLTNYEIQLSNSNSSQR